MHLTIGMRSQLFRSGLHNDIVPVVLCRYFLNSIGEPYGNFFLILLTASSLNRVLLTINAVKSVNTHVFSQEARN